MAAGAFGAHGLRERLDARHLEIWETAARYHMFHALGLFVCAWLEARVAGWLMAAGIAIFSGSLYALAATGAGALGAITPLGGACFLAAWAVLAISGSRRSRR